MREKDAHKCTDAFLWKYTVNEMSFFNNRNLKNVNNIPRYIHIPLVECC